MLTTRELFAKWVEDRYSGMENADPAAAPAAPEDPPAAPDPDGSHGMPPADHENGQPGSVSEMFDAWANSAWGR